MATDGNIGFLLSDSVTYAARGVPIVKGFAAKALMLPHAQSVIAFAGPTLAAASVCDSVRHCGDYDQIRSALPEALRKVIVTLGKHHPNWVEFLRCCGAYVLGFSPSAQAVRCLVCWTQGGELTLDEAPIILAPRLSDAEEAAAWRTCDRPDLPRLPAQLLAIMKKQRRCGRASDGRLGIVGGCATLTAVTRNEISQRVIHRWPDVIGQPIGAAPSVAA